MQGPLIPQYSQFQTEYTKLLKVNELTNNIITIKNGSISGLTIPIDPYDLSNNKYLNDTLDFSKTLTEVFIDSASDVTYTSDQLLSSIIYRDPVGATRFDKIGPIITNYNQFIIIIMNIGLTDTIVLDTSSLGILTNIIIYPVSTSYFFCTRKNGIIYAYYYTNIYNDLSFITNMNGLYIDNINTKQIIPSYINIYNFSILSNDIPAVPNCIFNILGDYNVQTTGSFDIFGRLPTGSQIETIFGSQLENGTAFYFTLKLTAFVARLPLLYTYTILNAIDSSIVLDPDSLFTIQFSELSWKYASYVIIYKESVFTIYCLNVYDIQTYNK